MFSKLNFLGVANATKTTAVVASATTSAKAVVASATTLAKAVAGVATSAKKIGAVKKFTAFTAMALVAFSLTACGGGDSAASASDEGDEIYLAWFNSKDYSKNYILEKVERFEGVADNPELGNALKVSQIARTYKEKNEFKPEQEWTRYICSEYFFTAYTPDGVEKMLVSISRFTEVPLGGKLPSYNVAAVMNSDSTKYYPGNAGLSITFDIQNKGTGRVVYNRLQREKLNSLDIRYTSVGAKGKFTFDVK